MLSPDVVPTIAAPLMDQSLQFPASADLAMHSMIHIFKFHIQGFNKLWVENSFKIIISVLNRFFSVENITTIHITYTVFCVQVIIRWLKV